MPYDKDDYQLKDRPKARSKLGSFLINNKQTGLQLLGKADLSMRFKKSVEKQKKDLMRRGMLK